MDTKEIASLISGVRSKINRFLVKELKRNNIEGLAPSHGAILFYLFSHEKVTMKDLAKAVKRDKSTVTALVAKLVSNGFVSKSTCEGDQRSVVVCLTSKGREIKPIFMDISNNLIEQIWKGIDKTEKEFMLKMLCKIGDNLS